MIINNESNDTIATAFETGFSSRNPATFVGRGFIGDNDNIDTDDNDVDILEFQLNGGDRINIDIDASQDGSPLDSILRVFNSSGNQLAVNDDSRGLDSAINFTANSTGTYYVGVSSFSNFDYNPFSPNSGEGSSTGRYRIDLSLADPFSTPDISGTSRRDELRGTNRRDIIVGLGGNDSIFAQGGNDRISGGFGNDFIDGGNGNDIISGDVGRDRIFGGNGNDVIDGGGDSDSIDGGNGNDMISGGGGRNFLLGGSGNDTIKGGGASDSLNGGNGSDDLNGSNGNDDLTGGGGHDTLEGGNGRDSLLGGSGNDILTGVGTDGLSVFGTGEVDTLTGQGGADTFVLGDADRVYYDDGDVTTSGRSDRAIITDFNARLDTIELHASADLYRLDFFPSGGVTSANIIYDPGVSAVGEVIATVQNVSDTLTLADSAFVFV